MSKTVVRGLLCFSLLFFSGCSLFHSSNAVIKDGPPTEPFDPNKIVEVEPKPEPKAKYGNHSPYEVFGKTYHVMESSQGYQTEGVASWYGTKFQGRHTSSWELYDLYAMTAAHKTLPLPTYVRVTNLENNRSVIVKVNDRGPFHGDRVIDLSYSAAYRLGYADKGTARVKISVIEFPQQPNTVLANQSTTVEAPSSETSTPELEALTPADDSPSVTNDLATTMQSRLTLTNPNSPVQLYVQAGAFKILATAQTLKNSLAEITNLPIIITDTDHSAPPTKVTDSNADNGDPIHRVRIGPLGNEEQAQLLAEVIRDQEIASPLLVWR